MKKLRLSLNIFSVALVVFLYALLRLSHTIIVLTNKHTESNELIKADRPGTDYPKQFKGAKQFHIFSK